MSERRFDPAKIDKLDNPERRKALPLQVPLQILSCINHPFQQWFQAIL